jgi:hypothetical protein
MKKFLTIVLGIVLAMPSMYSQTLPPWTENFDGTTTFTARPSGSWNYDSLYYLPGSSTTTPKSFLGRVPNRIGDSIILETPPYDCSSYSHVLLKFSHICKISPMDIVRIEFKLWGLGQWEAIPANTYLGSASNFSPRGFSAASYSEWQANDSTVLPAQSSWKEEIFDLTGEANGFSAVQFRFIIKHGQVPGTQISYGWLIDNFQLLAATHELYPPIVAFISPLVKDTVSNTGPWEINAKVKTQTDTAIMHPSLIYTATYNGSVVRDTILMSHVRGDSLWKVSIPQYPLGTEVIYYIEGQDSAGNFATATSGYIIGKGNISLILQDGGTGSASSYDPFVHYYGYSRSMSLYPAAEMGQKATGRINKIALRVYQAGSGAFPMKVWLKTVPASKTTWSNATDNLDWSILTQDATLVYDAPFHFSATGWFDIPLNSTFFYNGSDNLVVMFEQNCGGSSCNGSGYMSTYSTYYSSTSATNTYWYKNRDNDPPSTSTFLYIDSYRPDLRISVLDVDHANSAELSSIDINDTVIISPSSGSTIPVTVTIKNKGSISLDSAIVSYSVNGSLPPVSQSVYFNPALSWDFNRQVSLNNYTPKLNGYDTLKVWVKMPNGVADSTVYDDTLVSVIYGTGDILMTFVDPPTDTIFNTGPFEVKARIRKLSGDPVVSPINLEVTTTYGGVTTSEILSMTLDPADNLWKVFIPHKQFGSDVGYAITLTDKYTNSVKIIEHFYVEAISCGVCNVSDNDMRVPSSGNNNYTICTGMLYPHLGDAYGTTGGYSSYCSGYTVLYPFTKGAVIQVSGTCGTESGNYDYVRIYDGVGTGGTMLGEYYGKNGTIPLLTSTTGPITVYFKSDVSGQTSSDSSYFGFRINVNSIGGARLCVDTSVAMVGIESPSSIEIIGTPVPITVRIRNKGIDNLKKCTIAWTVNGQAGQNSPYTWTGDLSEDFTEAVTVGAYTPKMGGDTIVVWVSMPNGILDSILKDDTSSITVYSCVGAMSGDYIIGAGGMSIQEALKTLELCGASGDIRFLIEAGTYNVRWNLTNVGQNMGQHMLTITSQSGTKDVIFTPNSNVIILLNDARNIRFEHITMKMETGTQAIGFYCETTCENIIINNCVVLSDTTIGASGFDGAIAFEMGGNIPIKNITITNNHLRGGRFGILTGGDGVSDTLFGVENLIIENNIITHQYLWGIIPQFTHLTSLAHNTIKSRTANVSSTWHAINAYVVNGNILSNRIYQQSANIDTTYGIRLLAHNYFFNSNRNKGLVANNEIILSTTKGNYGIHAEYSISEIINNSIYISGSGLGRGIYIANSDYNNMVIKNNNIVTTSSSAYPIYFSATGNLRNYSIDYNNYNAPVNIGYYGSAITTMSAWQQQITTDLHSVNVSPVFIDITRNLSLLHSGGISCPRITGATEDINGITRNVNTAMGCYAINTTGLDLMILQLSGWNDEIVRNQILQVGIDVINLSVTTITNATFGWSINGQTQTPVSLMFNPGLATLQEQTLSIASFNAAGADNFEVVVWVESLNNNLSDPINWNDTVSGFAPVRLLVEFVAPFIADTIYDLNFDVNVNIRTITGAPQSPPQLTLVTTMENVPPFYDTIPMTFNSGIWTASIPQWYYNSKIIFSLTVSDSMGTVSIITDSVYIQYSSKNDTVIIGTGTSGIAANPYHYNFDYSQSRNYYMDYEIEANRQGGLISSIAFYKTNTGLSSVNNISFYMKAVPDSTITTLAYIDPMTDGAALVWGPKTSSFSATGWCEFVLDYPFVLPPNMNLLIYCDNQDGTYSGNGEVRWQYTSVRGKTCAVYEDGNFPPTTGSSRFDTTYRPNIKIAISVFPKTYTGSNLAVIELLSPVNDPSVSCTPDYTPVQAVIRNLGEEDYDFTQDAVTFSVEVITSSGIRNTASVIKNTGILESGKMDTVEIMSALPIMYAGIYDIKVWLTSTNQIDLVPYDDMLNYTLISNRIGLPVDEYFSSNDIPIEFSSGSIVPPSGTGETWIPYMDTTGQLLSMPDTVKSMLRYTGKSGTMAQLITRQLDLSGVIDPLLTFWYYHDASTPDLDRSYTDVNIIVDGVINNVYNLKRGGATTGWVQYSVPLDKYRGECILIQFESMNGYDSLSAQYIYHIMITSTPDLKVSEILISPEVDICDMTNRTLKAVLRTMVNQTFNLQGTSLTVEIDSQPPFTYPLSKSIAGNSSDTVTIITGVDLTDIKNIKIYMTSPVDSNSLNDTVNFILDFRPDLSLTVNAMTTGDNCFPIGTPVQQEIVLKNTGNTYLSGIKLELHITGDNHTATVIETKTIDLLADSSIFYRFENAYIAPAEALYQVQVTASLGCNPDLASKTDAINECADIHNVSIDSLINPPMNRIDTVGSMENIIVSIKNKSDRKRYENVNITMLIINENRQIINSAIGIIPVIEANSTYQFTFTEAYTIPDHSYYIRVYLSSIDTYHGDDTLFVLRTTVKREVGITPIGGINVFTLAQNIPNPATNSTRIDYSVPEAGEVVFHVHSIGGQLLYSKTIEASRGTNSLELNTSTFAAGVYFYSMVYKGQKRVKQLIINN